MQCASRRCDGHEVGTGQVGPQRRRGPNVGESRFVAVGSLRPTTTVPGKLRVPCAFTPASLRWTSWPPRGIHSLVREALVLAVKPAWVAPTAQGGVESGQTRERPGDGSPGVRRRPDGLRPLACGHGERRHVPNGVDHVGPRAAERACYDADEVITILLRLGRVGHVGSVWVMYGNTARTIL